jgi:hypothetical protein
VEAPAENDRWTQAEEQYWAERQRQTSARRTLIWVFLGVAVYLLLMFSGGLPFR